MFKIKDISFALAVLIMSFLIGYFVFAWIEPSQNPPEGNVPGPINVGDINQVKSGGLSVGSFISRFGTILGLESGNVGIGTTTTEAKLHVEGHAIAFDPIEDSHLVTKRYLEQYVAERCPQNGGVENGNGSSNGDGTTPPPTACADFSYGGQDYLTVKIDNQCWMAENLNYNVTGSYCYDNNSYYCTIYGRLYEWSPAATSCPTGWHLASKPAWQNLINYLGTDYGFKLKADIVWDGTNISKFTALPGGASFWSDGRLYHMYIGESAYFWTVSSSQSDTAMRGYLTTGSGLISWSEVNKNQRYSVRCLKNLDPVSVSTITDSRDGKVYQTVEMGSQTWMAENLNYASADSYCYANNSYFCTIYGRFYTWNSASPSCPTGWHLPSRAAWDNLTNYLGIDYGFKLKANIVWDGTNTSKFTALPGGASFYVSGVLHHMYIGESAYFWTVSSSQPDTAMRGYLTTGSGLISWSEVSKGQRYSVRCLKD